MSQSNRDDLLERIEREKGKIMSFSPKDSVSLGDSSVVDKAQILNGRISSFLGAIKGMERQSSKENKDLLPKVKELEDLLMSKIREAKQIKDIGDKVVDPFAGKTPAVREEKKAAPVEEKIDPKEKPTVAVSDDFNVHFKVIVTAVETQSAALKAFEERDKKRMFGGNSLKRAISLELRNTLDTSLVILKSPGKSEPDKVEAAKKIMQAVHNAEQRIILEVKENIEKKNSSKGEKSVKYPISTLKDGLERLIRDLGKAANAKYGDSPRHGR